jgi:hypothetical protein
MFFIEFKLLRISHQSFQRHSEGQLPNACVVLTGKMLMYYNNYIFLLKKVVETFFFFAFLVPLKYVKGYVQGKEDTWLIYHTSHISKNVFKLYNHLLAYTQYDILAKIILQTQLFGMPIADKALLMNIHDTHT